MELVPYVNLGDGSTISSVIVHRDGGASAIFPLAFPSFMDILVCVDRVTSVLIGDCRALSSSAQQEAIALQVSIHPLRVA